MRLGRKRLGLWVLEFEDRTWCLVHSRCSVSDGLQLRCRWHKPVKAGSVHAFSYVGLQRVGLNRVCLGGEAEKLGLMSWEEAAGLLVEWREEEAHEDEEEDRQEALRWLLCDCGLRQVQRVGWHWGQVCQDSRTVVYSSSAGAWVYEFRVVKPIKDLIAGTWKSLLKGHFCSKEEQ